MWVVSVWVFMFLIGFLSLAGERSHLLMSLLSLEVINLAIFVGFTMFGIGWDTLSGLVFIGLAACEGVLGLTAMVNMVRVLGSDMTDSLVLW